MRDEQLRAVLHGLGIDNDTVGALTLLPLVQVAWADGRVQDTERALIMDIAADRGLINQESQRLLDSWLRFRPSAGYLARARLALVELAHRQDADALPPGTIDDLLMLSQRVAKAAGGLFLGIASVDAAEKSVLEEISDRLQVDRSRNWEELLDALPEGPLPPAPPAAEPPAAAAEDVPVDESEAPTWREPDPETDLATEEADHDDDSFDEAAWDAAPPVQGDAADAEDAGDDITDGDQAAPVVDDLLATLPAVPADQLLPREPARAARLVVLGVDDDPDQPYPLDEPPVTVGRRTDNGLSLRWDARASRVHCLLRQEGARWYLVDCGSVNGTKVNGELVLERRLFGNEVIEVGDTRLRFEWVEPASA